ncbi:hypothetical protein [Luteibacter sp. 329MFSha]|uniref:hypothetical protein n=1 Tax=Luteibacter sp. 329MFSha TaxID=1798239 RepID=UPI0008CDD7DF|nr:hypothetical protein [Luteibacter sp. 329MFSha]SEW16765.1 hypothetical protein SAMN04515660_2735 [Luteibacter sp. 329MFSha]
MDDTFIMNTTNLDDISLEQALIDFEVANARVMDLTARLTSLSRELLEARTELARAQVAGATDINAKLAGPEVAELEHLRNVVAQVRASRIVRVASIFSGKLHKVIA